LVKNIYHISYMHAWGYLQLLFWEKLPANTDRSSFTGPHLLYQRSRKTTDHLGFITTKKSPSPWTFLLLLLLTLSHLSPGFSWWFPRHQKNQLWSDNWPLDYVELGLYVTTLEFIYFIFYFLYEFASANASSNKDSACSKQRAPSLTTWKCLFKKANSWQM
jgi:hypothetical protein